MSIKAPKNAASLQYLRWNETPEEFKASLRTGKRRASTSRAAETAQRLSCKARTKLFLKMFENMSQDHKQLKFLRNA